MAPVKFDDISKTAAEVLNDDFKTSGYEFKAKQKNKLGWCGGNLNLRPLPFKQ